MTIKYGHIVAKRVIARISELYAARDLYDIHQLPQTNLHPIKHNWKGHFSIVLQYPLVLIILPLNGNNYPDYKSITNVKIIAIDNTHF